MPTPPTGSNRLHQHLIEQILFTLRRIMGEGVYADKAIEQAFKFHPKWGSRDRRLFAESTYDIVRWWRMLWHLAALPEKDYLKPTALSDTALWRVWGVYWLSRGKALPDWDVCRGIRMLKNPQSTPAIEASVPDWLYERAERELKKDWPSILEALNKPADVFLRVNTLKYKLRDLQIKLGAEDCDTQTVPDVPDAIRLIERRNVFTSPLFKAGYFEVQDAASQIIAPFVQVEPGMRVIDACAGAGGKTLHLGTLMKNKGRIIALDVHEYKLKELRKRATRNGVDNIEERVIEGSQTIKRLIASADRVLLDVPCSGTGVLRRNPDAKWKLSDEEIERLILLQAEILRSHSRMVKPGGKLVYATCSILPSENEKQIKSFLAENGGEWSLENQIHLRPDKQGFDGFYAARLIRLAPKA
ncbi:methyltransferase domain-containing protein [Phragmitibacter flavus]|uniref:Methyltransferase domain-containing protein n=1 Tax=Phragmitibacter flavus TaxID=2576071 RepID=A0A5R8KCR2_9BACT|nr:methyltransferase domain-containing protein [Phragmitibacter flavus]TLD70027.1 methyltransferase domain-containing protein [Phragmitibacter flavus]